MRFTYRVSSLIKLFELFLIQIVVCGALFYLSSGCMVAIIKSSTFTEFKFQWGIMVIPNAHDQKGEISP